VDRDILADSAREVGAPADLIEIRAAETARFAAERLAASASPKSPPAGDQGHPQPATHYPGAYRLTVLVCDFEGRFICRVEQDEALTLHPPRHPRRRLGRPVRYRPPAAGGRPGHRRRRTLDLVRPTAAGAQLRDMDGQLGRVPADHGRPRAAGHRVVACWPPATRCATASPRLPDRQARAQGPEIRRPCRRCSCLRPPHAWQDIKIASRHTADAGEWLAGARPSHGLYR
jgi:hypothetical protein